MDQTLFTFPIVGFAKVLVRNDERDCGVRDFLDWKAFTRIYDIDFAHRQGMILVDAAGRSWEILAVRIMGRAFPILAWLRWLISDWSEYQIAYELAERPPMSFEAVKVLLREDVRANARFYRGEIKSRLAAIDRAETLSDIVNDEVKNPPPAKHGWVGWMVGEGRSNRREFLLIGLPAALICWAIGWGLVLPLRLAVLLFPVLIVAAPLAVVAIARRLHDMGMGWGRILLFFGWTLVVAEIHDGLHGAWPWPIASAVWNLSVAVCLAWLALRPGMDRPNTHGPAKA